MKTKCILAYLVIWLILIFFFIILEYTVKLLDWGEEDYSTASETAHLRAQFRQEVAVWQKLDHPNVTKVLVINKMSSFQFVNLSFCTFIIIYCKLYVIKL